MNQCLSADSLVIYYLYASLNRLMILVRIMLRIEGGYWGVLDGEGNIGGVMNSRRSCHDAFNVSLHWSGPSGEVTCGQRVPPTGWKRNLMRIVVSGTEGASSTDNGKMSHLSTLEALGMWHWT